MRIEICIVRMRIPCGRNRFDSIRIECAFDPDKCTRVDTPKEFNNCMHALRGYMSLYMHIYTVCFPYAPLSNPDSEHCPCKYSSVTLLSSQLLMYSSRSLFAVNRQESISAFSLMSFSTSALKNASDITFLDRLPIENKNPKT